MIQLTKAALPGNSSIRIRTGSEKEWERLRAHFDARHYVRFESFVDRALAQEMAQQIDRSEFDSVTYHQVGSEVSMKPNATISLLNFWLNEPELLDLVRHITGCHDIGFFHGRVYRMDPSSGQSFHWHNDLGERDRRVAMSLNLSSSEYAGGLLQLRKKDSESIEPVPNVGLGDAVMFRLADDLEHRVTPVEGTTPKVALAGWFRSGPTLLSMIKRAGAPEPPDQGA